MKRLAILLSFALLAGAGCPTLVPGNRGADDDSEAGVGAQAAFPVGSWELETVTRSGQPAEGVADIGSTLTLGADGQLSARICNSMSGGYSVADGALTAPQVMSTLMFCAGVPGEVEATFSQDLAAGFRVAGEGDRLVLRGDSGTSFGYERADDEDEQDGDKNTDADVDEEEDEDGEDGDKDEDGEDRSANGSVTSVNLDAIAYDGPAVVKIRTEAGAEVTIHVPSFGIALCEAKANIADVYSMKAGERVEVRGEVSEEGAIVPCRSEDHYLRVQK